MPALQYDESADIVVDSWPLFLVNTNTEGVCDDNTEICTCLEPFAAGKQLRHLESLEPHESYTEDLLVEFDLFKAVDASHATHLMTHPEFDKMMLGLRWKTAHQKLEALYDPTGLQPCQDGAKHTGIEPDRTVIPHEGLSDSDFNVHCADQHNEIREEKSADQDSASGDESAFRSDSCISASKLYRLASNREHGEYNTVLLRKVMLADQRTAFIMVPMHAVLHMLPAGVVRSPALENPNASELRNMCAESPVEVDVIFRRADRSKSLGSNELQPSLRRQTFDAEPWVQVPYTPPTNESDIEELHREVLLSLSEAPPARLLHRAEQRDRLARPRTDRRFTAERYQMDSHSIERMLVISVDRWIGAPEIRTAQDEGIIRETRRTRMKICLKRLLCRAQVVPFDRLLSAMRSFVPCEEAELVDIIGDKTFLVRGAIVLDSEHFFESRAAATDCYLQDGRNRNCEDLSMLRTLILALFDGAEPDGVLTSARLSEVIGIQLRKHIELVMNGIALKHPGGSYQFPVKHSSYMLRTHPEVARSLSQRLRLAADIAQKHLLQIFETGQIPSSMLVSTSPTSKASELRHRRGGIRSRSNAW
ncbi:hypothetical protein CCYA_CCYA12G3383 [Cyanidiococcus yangmingshanensis]|uniref:Uncharacterized protein n=1 Tax=Cyanidiococcus yangmingshanensis TaxID=2690220 RepID=A0A7J7IFP9_9RHOD|nr:hypothetical protein F1559_001168 [Cyanidiococcus yangmingshanensis]KAK4532526.1 hypothetical protein CCYA_CCYA12G3383 [Cyanidiococcus yangmingshanensis]